MCTTAVREEEEEEEKEEEEEETWEMLRALSTCRHKYMYCKVI